MIPFLFGLKQKVLSVGAFFIAIINSITFAWPALGFACLIIWLFSTGYLLGSRWHPNGTRYEQTFIGSLMLLSATSIFGSVAYYAGSIPKSILVLLLGGLTLICIFVAREAKAPPSATKSIPRSLTLVIATMVCLAAWWIACFDVAILESIRSPWLVLNPFTISALGLAAAFMSAMILRGSRKAALPLFIFVLLSALGLAAAIYPLGYGFDPFIHRATVEHIAQFGTITPKPLYYIGEYILELCGALIFSLPLKVFDAWLVPVLSSILLTGSAWIGFGKEQRTGILALLFVPLSAFISTTPQSLAYVLTASLLFLSLPLLRKEKTPIPLSILWMLAVAAISTHPLAGIPAFIYTTLVSVCVSNIARHLRILLSTLIALIGSVALPFIFAIQAQISGLAMSFSPEGLWDISRVDLTSFFDNRYSTWLDGMYLFIENQLWILLLFATISVVLMRRMRNNHLPLLAALMWFVNFWFLSTTLEFSFLIEYERANYADRLLVMTMIFLLPTLGMLIAEIIRRLEHQPAIHGRVSSFSSLSVFVPMFMEPILATTITRARRGLMSVRTIFPPSTRFMRREMVRISSSLRTRRSPQRHLRHLDLKRITTAIFSIIPSQPVESSITTTSRWLKKNPHARPCWKQ